MGELSHEPSAEGSSLLLAEQGTAAPRNLRSICSLCLGLVIGVLLGYASKSSPRNFLEQGHQAPAQSRFAFVMMAIHPKDVALGSYIWPVLPTARALQKMKSKYPLVLITDTDTMPDGSSVNQTLKKLNAYSLPAISVPCPDRIASFFRKAYWRYAWQKLQIWRLTQFDKIIWLDSDSTITRDLDWLFERQGLWMQRDNWNCTDEFRGNAFCSGMMLLEPSEEKYKGLVEYSDTAKDTRMGDQGLIAEYYSKVRKEDVHLLDHSVAAFGHCLGKLPGVPYREGESKVPGVWDMPAFVHKSSRKNECFDFNLSRQTLSVEGSVRNVCDYNPYGPYWRGLFCEAVEMSGVTSGDVRRFCGTFF
eukprot:TRINITY_DN37053_c0_g1_i1.p1 TRINITY_DN37053_c0_g1~~TRINITY_DN37053_c0_g1_i1.p1  ORF type:complete len:361 (-),score=55.30 TRINITY_DN37053_c0_g1_i1:516-1598(-)